jgi:hypothetical protein
MFALLGVFWPVAVQIRLFGCTRGWGASADRRLVNGLLGAVAAGGGWPLLLGGSGRGSGVVEGSACRWRVPGRGGRRGRRGAGRWPVPAAGNPRRGWGCRRGGGCCRCQVGQHPARSWTSSRFEASAFNSPAVRPVLSASARTSATPVRHVPVLSAVTCKPFSQPVVLTYQVLLGLGPDKDFDTPIVPVQEHFLLLPYRPAHTAG